MEFGVPSSLSLDYGLLERLQSKLYHIPFEVRALFSLNNSYAKKMKYVSYSVVKENSSVIVEP